MGAILVFMMLWNCGMIIGKRDGFEPHGKHEGPPHVLLGKDISLACVTTLTIFYICLLDRCW